MKIINKSIKFINRYQVSLINNKERLFFYVSIGN